MGAFGSLLYSTLIFVLVLGAMIVIHEFGHFIVAKLFGIRVDIFSVGFGKRLFGIKKGDTDYRLSLIPLGGYVKMAGENLDEATTGAPYEFQSKPKWQRLCVAVAGPVMNILTALAIPAILAMMHYEVAIYRTQPAVVSAVNIDSAAETAGIRRGDLIASIDGVDDPTWEEVNDRILINPDHDIPVTIKRGSETLHLTMHVGSVEVEREKIGDAGFEPFLGANTKLVVGALAPGMPGEQAGLKVDDQIVAINGRPVASGVDPSTTPATADTATGPLYGRFDVTRIIRQSTDKPVTFTVKRGDEIIPPIVATPKMDDGRLVIGFTPLLKDADVEITKLSPIAALKFSYNSNLRILSLTKTALAQVFTGRRSARDTVSGPVGIAQIVGQAAERSATEVFELMGLLSLNLGIFNLLPIPVLDGGLIFMLLLEALLGIFGLPLTLRIKERMMQVGFVMLMLLMGFVIFNDISKRFVSRGSPTPAIEQTKPENK